MTTIPEQDPQQPRHPSGDPIRLLRWLVPAGVLAALFPLGVAYGYLDISAVSGLGGAMLVAYLAPVAGFLWHDVAGNYTAELLAAGTWYAARRMVLAWRRRRARPETVRPPAE
ncbi:hypothetical protein ACFRCI_45530 [Streptomyces sp. NPDC056638]|uniref:hypothetical protein n=1 Tax=Streptomyces sp. NPDC056638 TaxID=3345887 RepID=UPI0036CA0C82